MMIHELELLEKFRDLHLDVSMRAMSLHLTKLEIRNELQKRIKVAQLENEDVLQKMGQPDFSETSDGVILFHGRIVIPDNDGLK